MIKNTKSINNKLVYTDSLAKIKTLESQLETANKNSTASESGKFISSFFYYFFFFFFLLFQRLNYNE